MSVAFATAALLAPVLVRAAGPEACDPREDPTVCELKVERNNAMDELAIAGGKLRVMRDREASLAKWLAEYIDGVNREIDWWRGYAEGVNAKASHHH